MAKIKEASTNNENKQKLMAECNEVYASHLIAGQWTLAICCHLINGKLRFGELHKHLPGVTERMLSLQLRKMETNKLLKRRVYAEVPARVEYELTTIGKELVPIISQLEAWGKKHRGLTKAE